MFEQEIAQALKRQEIKNQLGIRKTGYDNLIITPTVTFYEGTPDKPIRFITAGKGRLVSNALISIVNLMSGTVSAATQNYFWMSSYGVGTDVCPPLVPSIRLGTGTTATAQNTTALVTPLAIAPDLISGTVSNPSSGVYRISYDATWNAGALGTPTITEAALFGKANAVLRAFETADLVSSSVAIVLVDRITSTDEDFEAFEVNGSNPLTVQYQIECRFA
jgi:hypothetical protein